MHSVVNVKFSIFEVHHFYQFMLQKVSKLLSSMMFICLFLTPYIKKLNENHYSSAAEERQKPLIDIRDSQLLKYAAPLRVLDRLCGTLELQFMCK